MALAVTTCHQPTEAIDARARALATRFSVPFWQPRVRADVWAAGFSHLYVVGRAREEVRGPTSVSFVQEGLLAAKRHAGLKHPLMRALGACETLVDCTLGLANDALHAATMLGCRVKGIEGSAVLHALLEEGLPRLTRMHPAAANIELLHGQALDVLRRLDDNSHDVVYLDPMMSTPEAASPAFVLVRELAVTDAASPELLEEAARVARARVVLKRERGAPPPGARGWTFDDCEEGGRVTYWLRRV